MNPMDFGGKGPVFYAAVLVGLAVIVGGIVVVGTDRPTTANRTASGELTTYAATYSPSSYVRHWGYDQGHVEIPAGVEWVDPGSMLKAFEMAQTGQADTGFVPLTTLPRTLQSNPDVMLLDYGYRFDPKQSGLFTRNDSDIDSLQDLEGKTIAVHQAISIGVATMLALHYEGVNLSTVEVLNKPRGVSRGLLETGNVDAALTGMPAPDNARPLLYPIQYWEEKHNVTFMAAPWFTNGMDHYVNSIKMAHTYDRSMEVGYNNISAALATWEEKTGQEVDRSEFSTVPRIVEVSEKEWDVVQTFMDDAYEYGYMDTRIDIDDVRVQCHLGNTACS